MSERDEIDERGFDGIGRLNGHGFCGCSVTVYGADVDSLLKEELYLFIGFNAIEMN